MTERSDTTMTPERWRQVFGVLDEAFEVPEAEREAFLDRACEGDDELRREVEELLSSYRDAGTFIDDPAAWVDFTVDGEGSAEPSVVEETQIGGYEVKRTLGRGGMGAVYLAVRSDGEYEQEVAVKVLQAGLTSHEMVRRFVSERQILANLDHPHIAKLLDGGTTEDGRPYLVMEYVDGTPIDRLCEQSEMDTRQRLELFCEVCRAVHFAHQNLVVHRDLKPRNIMITHEGEPKLLDFGIAKLLRPEAFQQTVLPTRTGLMPMTPEYASPEQVRGAIITTASDVYSLGVLLYELLTGRRPYRLASRDPLEVARAVCEEQPEKPSTAVARGPRAQTIEATTLKAGEPEASRTLPEEQAAERIERRQKRRRLAGDLDNIALMALAKEPQQRYGSAEQLAQDIERHLGGMPVKARKHTLIYRTGKFVQRHRVAVTVAAAVFAILVSLLVMLVLQRERILQERNIARYVSDFMVDLFTVVDPSRARGEKITALDLLDRGADAIDQKLADQPELMAAMKEYMGRSYKNLGFYPEAEPLLESSLRLRTDLRDENDPDIASSLGALADLRSVQGEYSEAEDLYRRSLGILRRARGRDALAEGLVELSGTLVWLNQHDAAKEALEEALGFARGSGSEELEAMVLSHQGLLNKKVLKYPEAEAKLYEALSIYRQIYDGPHPDTASALNNLGTAFDAQGLNDKAEAYYREAERMQRRLFDGNHHDLALTLNNLAELMRRLGRFEESRKLYAETLQMRRELFGEDPHPRVASTIMGQANVLFDLGDTEGAEKYYLEALEIRRSALGDDHPDTATSLDAVADIYARRGELDEAEALYLEALDILIRHRGEEHPQVGATINNLADLAFDRGDLERAEELYRRALDIFRKSNSPEHSRVASVQYNLASLLQAQRRYEDAELNYLESLDLVRRNLGDHHILEGQILGSLAMMKHRLEDHGASETMLRDALVIFQEVLPEGHGWIRGGRAQLGVCLKELERYQEAEPFFVERYEHLRDEVGAESPRTRKALERLIELYREWGKPDKVREYEAL